MLVRMFRDPSIDVDAHEEAATRLVELFEGLGDDRGSALAWEERAYAHWFRLRMKASGTAAEQALTYAKAAGAPRHIGSGLTLLGEFDEARRLVAEGRAITLELGQTIEHLASALGAARIEWLAGDVDAAAEILRESCERLDELGETAFPVDERRLPDDARGRAG
jgi:hypothetical protein